MPYLPSERRPPSRRNGISLPSLHAAAVIPPSSRTAIINQFFTSEPNRQPAGSPRHLEKRRLFQAANLPVARLLARSLFRYLTRRAAAAIAAAVASKGAWIALPSHGVVRPDTGGAEEEGGRRSLPETLSGRACPKRPF